MLTTLSTNRLCSLLMLQPLTTSRSLSPSSQWTVPKLTSNQSAKFTLFTKIYSLLTLKEMSSKPNLSSNPAKKSKIPHRENSTLWEKKMPNSMPLWSDIGDNCRNFLHNIRRKWWVLSVLVIWAKSAAKIPKKQATLVLTLQEVEVSKDKILSPQSDPSSPTWQTKSPLCSTQTVLSVFCKL